MGINISRLSFSERLDNVCSADDHVLHTRFVNKLYLIRAQAHHIKCFPYAYDFSALKLAKERYDQTRSPSSGPAFPQSHVRV
jgi:hypothetical protein